MNENNNPLVSIGIPTYDRIDGLKVSLECFCNQKYENLEIIVSDNCSPTDPTEMVQEFIKKDDRIKYFRQKKNIGMTLNGHFVWNKASGEFFTLASDDDWWGIDYVLELVKLLQYNKDAVCAFCDFQEVDLMGKRIDRYPYHYPLLKEFDEKDRNKRLENFILQKETDGKANMHRAICYRNVFLNSIAKLYDLGLAECWAFDQLLAFAFLVEGRLVVSDKLLFKCTVGNEKHYRDPRSRIRYLEGYEKIIDDKLNISDAIIVKKSLDIRYYDKEIRFYKEFLAILIEFILKSIAMSNDHSLQYLKKVSDLIVSGENAKAVKLAREFSSNVDILTIVRNFFAFGQKWKQIKIAKEIIKKVKNYEEDR